MVAVLNVLAGSLPSTDMFRHVPPDISNQKEKLIKIILFNVPFETLTVNNRKKTDQH